MDWKLKNVGRKITSPSVVRIEHCRQRHPQDEQEHDKKATLDFKWMLELQGYLDEKLRRYEKPRTVDSFLLSEVKYKRGVAWKKRI